MRKTAAAIVLGTLILAVSCGPPSRNENTLGSVCFDLSIYYNNDGISSNNNRRDGNIDTPENPYGSSYPAEELPSEYRIVPVTSVPGLLVLFPPREDGKLNNISCRKQILKGFTPLHYTAVYFVGSGTMGDQYGVFKVKYKDGTIENLELTFKDWCSKDLAITDVTAFKAQHRHTFQGEDEDTPCMMYALKIPVAAGKFLDQIQLPDKSDIHIFAVTAMVNI
ncbi:hypothetical protein ACFL4W_03875 [Planctomycetota bacterium]